MHVLIETRIIRYTYQAVFKILFYAEHNYDCLFHEFLHLQKKILNKLDVNHIKHHLMQTFSSH